MIIKLPVRFKGSKGEKILWALFDTGSLYSCIREDIAIELGKLDELPIPMLFETASENTFIKATHGMRINFELNDLILTDEFMVLSQLSEEAIIGVTTMQKWKLKLDFDRDAVITNPKVAKLILKDLKKLQLINAQP
ncbi:MAG TPA: retropepsin-like aspartic protease [Chitinophagaceae bacterium]|jgi:predicted aspartyl protease|nr:retropepsin-like aspartic protease [Chitinophagaceae bacterium]